MEEETDPDVLSLPVCRYYYFKQVAYALDVRQSLRSLAGSLNLWLPKRPSKAAELNLKRAVVSCFDSLTDPQNSGTFFYIFIFLFFVGVHFYWNISIIVTFIVLFNSI